MKDIAEKKLYKNKYRIKSTRLKGYDYSQNGLYFVTICTHKRICYFKNKKMVLNKIGGNANIYWQKIPNHFSFVRLDEFIIMPDHVHGIIIIDNNG